MAISYGGIALPTSTDPLESVLDHFVPNEQIQEFEGIYSSPSDLGHLPFSPLPPPTVRKFGQLMWPRQAAKYAYAHFLVSDRILALVRPLAYAGNQLNALPLVISDGTRTVTADMYMVPPRPISQVTIPNAPSGNLWLLTLVDDRYFWWYRNGDLEVTGLTTWGDLYDQIATILGVTITVDTVSSDYGRPTNRFTTFQQPIPIILDAVAYSVGQRIVRRLDGTVLAQNFTGAKTDYQTNYATITNRGFGGQIFTQNNPGVSGDMFALVPAAVRVVFPIQELTDGSVQSVYSLDTTLTSEGLAEYPSVVVGFPETQVAWGDAYALASGGVLPPTNFNALKMYATGFTRDWYNWQTYGTDVTYSGVGAWLPEGITDTIEYSYDSGMLMSRVQREPWNDRSGGGLEKVFAATTASGGTVRVRTEDGSVSSLVGTIFVPNTSLTNPLPNQVHLLETSLTNAGQINLVNQFVGDGNKYFNRFVWVNVSGGPDGGTNAGFPDTAFVVRAPTATGGGFDDYLQFSSADAMLSVAPNWPYTIAGTPGQLNPPVYVGQNLNRGGPGFGGYTSVQCAGAVEMDAAGTPWEWTAGTPTDRLASGFTNVAAVIRSNWTFPTGVDNRLLFDPFGRDDSDSPMYGVLRWGATVPAVGGFKYAYGCLDVLGNERVGIERDALPPFSDFVGGLCVKVNTDSISGEEYLAGDYAITTDDVWEDTGLSVTLPVPGKWRVTANVFATAVMVDNGSGLGGIGDIFTRLYDVTNSAPYPESTTFIVQEGINDSANNFTQRGSTIGFTSVVLYVTFASGTVTIRLEAERIRTVGVDWITSRIFGGSSGWNYTSIDFERIV